MAGMALDPNAGAAQSTAAHGCLLDSCRRNLKATSFDLTQVAPKPAAVLVPLFFDSQSGDVRVVLTMRSSKLNSHAGEVSLPGGKRDEEDADDAATAMREAEEEIGLSPADVDVICELPPLLSKHGLSVKPVVASVPSWFQPVPNEAEVTEVFHVPLRMFLEDRNRRHQDKVWEGVRYRVHFFEYESYTIWGLTAEILIQTAKLAFAATPEFEVSGDGVVSISTVHMAEGRVMAGRPKPLL